MSTLWDLIKHQKLGRGGSINTITKKFSEKNPEISLGLHFISQCCWVQILMIKNVNAPDRGGQSSIAMQWPSVVFCWLSALSYHLWALSKRGSSCPSFLTQATVLSAWPHADVHCSTKREKNRTAKIFAFHLYIYIYSKHFISDLRTCADDSDFLCVLSDFQSSLCKL